MAQAFAIIIFLAMFILIIMDKWPKQYVTLGCALLTLILVFGVGMHSMDAVIETLNVKSIFTQGVLVHRRSGFRDFKRYQLGDDRIPCRHDDHGRRNGSRWIFQMALHENCKTG